MYFVRTNLKMTNSQWFAYKWGQKHTYPPQLRWWEIEKNTSLDIHRSNLTGGGGDVLLVACWSEEEKTSSDFFILMQGKITPSKKFGINFLSSCRLCLSFECHNILCHSTLTINWSVCSLSCEVYKHSNVFFFFFWYNNSTLSKFRSEFSDAT